MTVSNPSSPVAVGNAAAVPLTPALNDPATFWLYNDGPNDCPIGGDVAMTAAAGPALKVGQGATFDLLATDQLYGRCAAGTASVRVLQVNG